MNREVVIIGIFILSIGIIIAENLQVYSFKREWSSEENESFAYGRLFSKGDKGFLYATCRQKSDVEMKCTLILEKPNIDGLSNFNYCHFFIKDDASETVYFTSVKLKRLGGDQALLVSSAKLKNSSFVRVSIINMTDCNTINIDFPAQSGLYMSPFEMVHYNNSFNIVVFNNKTMCGNSDAKKCIISYGIDGKVIGEPVPFQNDFMITHICPVSFDSPKDGFYYFGKLSGVHETTFQLLYVNSEGVQQKIFDLPQLNMYAIRTMLNSNSYKLYTICWSMSSLDEHVNCRQFDMSGKVMMNVTLEIKEPQKLFDIYNWPGGGLLYLSRGCLDKSNCTSFNVTRVNENGQQIGQIEITNMDFKCDLLTHYLTIDYLDDNDEYCIYIVCADEHIDFKRMKKSRNVQLRSKCLPKNISLNHVLPKQI